MTHNYKLEGSGKTTREADKQLKNEKSNLVRKLKSAEVSKELKIERTDYEAEYELKKQTTTEEGYLRAFSVKSSQSWKDVAEKARAHADIRQYDPTYTVRQFLKLTSEQKDALAGKKKKGGPTAGIEEPNSYDFLSQLR